MTLSQIAATGGLLISFLQRFAGRFGRSEPRRLLNAYVQGQLSDCERKSIEPMAIHTGTAPRTLQRFLESVQWDEQGLRDDCQRIIATEHADPRAIGIVDESGTRKSGGHTAGVGRQWCGNVGKVDNCTVGVHTVFATEGFHALIDSDLYLPEDWANDPERRQQAGIPDEVVFRTKPRIVGDQIERALANGIVVAAWTFDELYARDPKFLDRLDRLGQHFVAEVSVDFRGWLKRPPRAARSGYEVRNLVKYSPVFRQQEWVTYRVKDSEKGPVVWEVKWARLHRRTSAGLPSEAGCLIVARNPLNPEEIKYFVSNQVPGEQGVTLQWLLWVAFRRWPVEQCFREAKKELGMDHYQVRGWRSIHRHFYVTGLSHLFCARMRQQFAGSTKHGKLTVQQVRRAVNVWFATLDLPPSARKRRYRAELDKIAYYQKRNAQSRRSHTKTRLQRLSALGIDVDAIPSCIPSDTG